jgi:hypothetical protein
VISDRTCALVALAIIVTAGIVTVSSLVVMPSYTSTPLAAEITDARDGLRFTMALQNNTFKTGEPIDIAFTVTNISNQTMNYAHALPEFDFIVYNSSDSNLFRWTSFKVFAMIIWETPLNPGDSYTSILVWPQTCNQTEHNNEGVPVSPGQYSIIGLFLKYRLQTSPLQVNVGTDKPIPMIVAVGVVGAGLAVPVAVLVAAALTKRR